MKMRLSFAEARLVISMLLMCVALRAQQTPQNAPRQPNSEQQELQQAIQQAGPSVIDFIRALEQHLHKYPASAAKPQINRALFRAAKEMKDNRRMALYGERLLETDSTDVSLLEDTAKALNSFEDPKLSSRALGYGKKLEDLIQHADQPPANETFRDRGKRIFETSRQLGSAYLIQADATGIAGNAAAGFELAKKSFDLFPSAAAARSAGHWLAKAGNYDRAVEYYADAFAIADAPDNHADDRRKMAEYYLKTHPNEMGLGDAVLAAYDRVTVAAEKRKELFGNSNATKPIHFKLGTLDGKTFALESLKGKVIVMDFWATWCGPCREQHPLFDRVKEKYKNDDRVVFLEVDSDEDHSVVGPFIEQHKWGKDVYFEDGLARVLDIQNIPTTVLLDRKGEVYSKMIGFNPSSFVALLTSRIEEALATPPETSQL